MFHWLISLGLPVRSIGLVVFVFGSSDPFIVVAHAVLSIFLMVGEGTLVFVFILTSVFIGASTFVKLFYFFDQKCTNQKCTSSVAKYLYDIRRSYSLGKF